MSDPVNEWMAGFEAKIADMQRQSAVLQENIAASGATASSSDGGVRVTVGPTGALQDLQLGPSTTRYPPAQLASMIMQTAAQAQREAAHRVAAAFAPVAEGTEAMQILESFLPPPPHPDPDGPQDGLPGLDEIDEPSAPPPPPPAAPQPPRRPPAPPKDDEDFEEPW
jgi:DNA-binding protein YbaB